MSDLVLTLISAAIAAGVSLVISLITRHQTAYTFYSQMVTANRMEWIQAMRDYSARLLMFTETYETLTEEQAQEFHLVKNQILVRLNPANGSYIKDNEIRKLLENKTYTEIRAASNTLRVLFVELFKDEWDRCKIEAGRNKKMRRHIEHEREISS